MTTEDALLAEILDNPDELTPRAALADWCEENGKEGAAGRIREGLAGGTWGYAFTAMSPGTPCSLLYVNGFVEAMTVNLVPGVEWLIRAHFKGQPLKRVTFADHPGLEFRILRREGTAGWEFGFGLTIPERVSPPSPLLDRGVAAVRNPPLRIANVWGCSSRGELLDSLTFVFQRQLELLRRHPEWPWYYRPADQSYRNLRGQMYNSRFYNLLPPSLPPPFVFSGLI
jgi:uncharacterized protein (TIGR02996 family)